MGSVTPGNDTRVPLGDDTRVPLPGSLILLAGGALVATLVRRPLGL
jgi:hypothetical protein